MPFAPTSFVESYSSTVATDLAKEGHLKGLEKPKFVERLAHYFTEFNAVHPFREGNGRATREFVGQLARQAGYELDQTSIDNSSDQWNQAAAAARAGSMKALEAVFQDSIRPAKAVAFDQDEPADAMRKHPELRGAFITMKAAEVYAASAIADETARRQFIEKTRQHVRDTLHAGQDVPVPATRSKDVDRER